jgi:hypothetical protein
VAHAFLLVSIDYRFTDEPYVPGRDVVLEKLGISVDYWTSTGNAMALSELNLKYYAPLRVHVYLRSFATNKCTGNLHRIYLYLCILRLRRQSGDRFVVKVKPVQIKGVRMIVEHMIETLPERKVSMNWKHAVYVRLLTM